MSWLKEQQKEYQQKIRMRLFRVILNKPIGQACNPSCEECSEFDINKLHFAHKDPLVGERDRKYFGGWNHSCWRYYINNPVKARQNLKILCQSCNLKERRKPVFHYSDIMSKSSVTLTSDKKIRLESAYVEGFQTVSCIKTLSPALNAKSTLSGNVATSARETYSNN